MEIVKIEGEKREDLGKRATKDLRVAGRVPCTIYGKDTLIHFSASAISFKELIYTPDFKIAELEIDGQSYQGVVREIQFHPVSDDILHIDFQRLVEGRKIRVSVPLHMKGNSVGVRNGGRLIQSLRRVEIKSLPKDIVSELFVDITELDMGGTLRVEDIQKTNAFEIVNNPRLPVVSVAVPRTLKAAGLSPEEAEGEELEEEAEQEETAVE